MNTSKRAISTKNMVLTALMTALICILSPLTINIGPVPLSLSTLAILLSVVILGRNLGTLTVVIYLLIGLVGIPVFSNFSGGIGKLIGPTGGYLIGYIPYAFISGTFIERFPKNKLIQFLGMVVALAALYILGTLWLDRALTDMGFMGALKVGVIPFILGDLIKAAIALFLGSEIKKRISHIKQNS